ncbi:MAG: DUF2760 domain-containing protein, partial [Pirellulaceae bacterium]
VVYYIWGMLAWMVVPLHAPTINALPAEQAIVDALTEQDLESGVFVAPFATNSADMRDPESEFMKRHIAGPIFSIYYQKEGAAPMNAAVLGIGFVIDLLGALLAACLLSSIGPCGRNYWCRVGFVAGLGIFVALVGHLSYWNWMHFPAGYTVAFMIDVTVGWLLAGLAIAAFIRPQSIEAKSSAATVETEPEKRVAPAAVPQPTAPKRNDAISLLATLQREARLVDIVKEPLADYTDAQVGAAARDVLRDCGVVIDRLFKIEPILEQKEGAIVEIPPDADSARYRISGSTTGTATSGSLIHHGWQAKQCELPKWNGSKESAMIVSPAELEAK